jgi:hypothetical protein
MTDTKCKNCDTGCKFCDARFMWQTPYAWFHYKDFTLIFHDVWEELIEGHNDWVPLYLEQQRTWVGLTPEEMQQVFVANSVMVDNGNAYMVAGLRAINIGQAIEAKLKEKNETSSKN